ncbi:MAG: signal peptidase I [Kiritimatiellae bacterium]|nr:signal peptidase I [Kiritimatiellia bacterium]
MIELLKKRRTRKAAKEMLRHAKHLRNMRGDLMSEEDVSRIETAEQAVRDALRLGVVDRTEEATSALNAVLLQLTPPRRFGSFGENVEIIVVAVVVAMGFRAYFFQPFKIPTGSMEPTLFGIKSEANGHPTLLDGFPLKYAKWIVTGQMTHVIKAKSGGTLNDPYFYGRPPLSHNPSRSRVYVGAQKLSVPCMAQLNFKHGDYVPKGAVIWSGKVTAGDHVFVNKMTWNFRRPRRGEIMVFDTHGIQGIQQGTHYIKRMVGLPNDRVSVNPPYLMIGGEKVDKPEGIRRIAACEPGYYGYQTVQQGILQTSRDYFQLSDDEYFAMGDNTGNSKDSRYWGAVPRDNLVGPACMIYWPISRRWGVPE